MDQKSKIEREKQERQRKVQRQRKQKKLYWKIFGFCLFAFLLGFLFGRVVLAAEQERADKRQEEEFRQSEATGTSEEMLQTSVEEPVVFGKEEWNLILVNGGHPMPEDYQVELTEVGSGHQVDSRIAQALKDMIKAGKKAGHQIWIASSYRTMEKQTELFENKVAKLRRQGYSEKEARKEAGTVVAVPGTSEHQLGLAVDLVSSEYTSLDERQEETKSYQWLVEHCAEFGFILRYPNGKTDVTGIIYEPWHFRYVGTEAAREIMEQGICLEEYLEQKEEQDE
ncbi:MAG: M15 family metallopeptidase [Lachnospiraceae bacterium]|nr:M15 family metallopeptidase [Lachnospiraceae bacterium]